MVTQVKGSVSPVLTTATTTELEDVSSAVNTVSKYDTKAVKNSTTSVILWAEGATAGDVWKDSSGVTQHTPV